MLSTIGVSRLPCSRNDTHSQSGIRHDFGSPSVREAGSRIGPRAPVAVTPPLGLLLPAAPSQAGGRASLDSPWYVKENG
jgi:hypothetical protein